MNKLEVGMYVRFKDKNDCTYIRKVIDGYKEHWYGCKVDKNANNVPYVSEKNIINASYDKIDLIEAGDYVNGLRIDKIIMKSKNELCFTYIYANEEYDVYTLKIEDIKSIVTKEQFERMEYKI